MHHSHPTPVFPTAFPKAEDHAGRVIRELLDHFLAVRRFADETKRAYTREINGYLASVRLDSKRQTFAALLAIEFPDLCNGIFLFLRACLKFEYETNRVLNPRTFNRRRHALSSFFFHLVKFFGFPSNPLIYIDCLQAPTRSNTPDLDEDEVLAILHDLKKRARESETRARDSLLVLGLLIVALRRREISEMRWDGIDFKHRSLLVKQKGDKEKLIPIPPGYCRLLKEFLIKYGRSCPFVFHPIQNNRFKTIHKPISVDYIYKVVRQTSERIIPSKKISPHSFRKTFVTLGLRWKVDINAIQNGTGHSSPGMVLYYDGRNPLEFNFIHLLGDFLKEKKII